MNKKDSVIGKYIKCKDENGHDYYKDMSATVKLGNEGSIIDKVFTCQTNEDGERMVKVRTCQNRPPVMGDKFATRNGQKGTFGIVMKREDLPYTEDGIVPDLILDPAGLPSRMTIPQFFEILFGNLAAELGVFGSYNAFDTFKAFTLLLFFSIIALPSILSFGALYFRPKKLNMSSSLVNVSDIFSPFFFSFMAYKPCSFIL